MALTDERITTATIVAGLATMGQSSSSTTIRAGRVYRGEAPSSARSAICASSNT
jgi:hypothetical protein